MHFKISGIAMAEYSRLRESSNFISYNTKGIQKILTETKIVWKMVYRVSNENDVAEIIDQLASFEFI